MKWLPVLLLIALSPAAAQAASETPVSVSALLSGQIVPLTVTLGSLDGRWCRFTTGAAGGTDIYSAMYGIEPTPYYTKGQTVRAGDQVYLLAYKAQIRPAGLWMVMAGRGGLGDVPTVTEETTLGLCLLNLATTGSFLDISVFDLASEIDRYAQAAERLQAAVDQMGVSYEEEVVEDNLDQIAIALEMYVIDHGDVLPPMATQAEWEEALSWYVADSSVFVDPATEEPYPINASLSGVELASMETPAMIVAVYEAQLRDDGTRKVVFADGSTGYIAEDAWAGMGGMKAASGIP